MNQPGLNDIIPAMIIEHGEQGRTPSDFINILHGDAVIHANALDDYSRGLETADWQSDYLTTYNCNSLNSPNITDWEAATNGLPDFGSHVISPNSKLHVSVISRARGMFLSLDWEKMRFLLAGEEGLQVAEPGSPITDNELDFYFDHAEARNVFRVASRPSAATFHPDVIGLHLSLGSYGLTPGAAFDDYKTIELHPRFRDKILAANIYKLASYLAVMDHATFEAQMEGRPVSAAHIPTGDRYRFDEFENYHTKKHGTPSPSMGELYGYAHSLFVSLIGDRRDGIIDHIVKQRELSYLV